jgi:predicted ribosomally synthesized peptide with SipW-like signal peptide
MKNFAAMGIFAYLIIGIIGIGGSWSYFTSVTPATGPDSSSTPNPMVGVK